VSPDDVGAAIRANNFQAAAGQSKGYFIVSNVTTNTDLTSIEQFKRMTVKAKDGGSVRLEDIATVELGAQSTDASVAMSGQQAIFIGVQSTPQGNPLNIVKVCAPVPGNRTQSAAVAEDARRLRLDQVHSVVDR
jgi:multidrug efflux pump